MKHITSESFAKEKLGGEVSLVWERLLKGKVYSRWERVGVLPVESCTVGVDDETGPYAITDGIGSLQRFILAANHQFKDVESSITLLKDLLPNSKRLLIDDPDGFTRQFIGGNWKSPFMENGLITFYCNDSERGIVERWTIDEFQLKVEYVAEGECFTFL